MAIFHLNVGHVSRSTGRSAVQSAAYITGESLHESRRDLTANYQNRQSDILFSATLAPEHAPDEFKELSVWDKFENYEDTYASKRYPKSDIAYDKYMNTARTAMTIVVALPKELSIDIAHDLVVDFTRERFISRGLVATYAIHEDEGNPHAHIQISTRAVEKDGTISWYKDRDISSPKGLIVVRKLWADMTNQYLEREGVEARITEKSFAADSIDLTPTQHRGWFADQLVSMGESSRIADENQKTYKNNQEKLQENPGEILNELNATNATFRETDILNSVRKRMGDDHKNIKTVFEGALKEAISVGTGMDGQVRYTGAKYKVIEEQALDKLFGVSYHVVDGLDKDVVDHILSHPDHQKLNDEQRDAVYGLTNGDGLSVLIGRAGAGKTTALKPVADAYKQEKWRLMGTSLSAVAAENLGTDADIPFATVAQLLHRWAKYDAAKEEFLKFDASLSKENLYKLSWYQDLVHYEQYQLNDRSVLIVDEAGMVGTKSWDLMLDHVLKTGAKLICIGDDHQFKAIEAGDFFRELKNTAEQHKCIYQLSQIIRQKESWMRNATSEMAELNVQDGLSKYVHHDFVHQTDDAHFASDIAKHYVNRLVEGASDEMPKTGLVLAYTKQECNDLNDAIRFELKTRGMIDKADLITVGGRSYAKGDSIVFLKNDRGMGVLNGTKGTLVSAVDTEDEKKLTVKLTDEKTVTFQVDAYKDINHGYALTTHKSQGKTVDFTILAASKMWDAISLYVAMTRHRETVDLYYKDADFKTKKALFSHFSKFANKDLVKDYTIRPEHEEAHQRVQEYKGAVLDAVSALKVKDYTAYNKIKADQISLGREILSDYDNHHKYVQQANLTKEALQIATGLKKRPLSIIEQRAKLNVELYQEYSEGARCLLNEMRAKVDDKRHIIYDENYKKYVAFRTERDDLAKHFLENVPLYKEHLGEARISQKVLMAQVDYAEKAQNKTQTKSKNVDQRTTELPKDNKYYGNWRVASDNSKSDISKSKTLKLESVDEHPVGATAENMPSKDSAVKHYESTSNKPYQSVRTSGEIIHDLNSKIKDLAYEFLGDPSQMNATTWRYGKKGSISINVAGQKMGLYSNFETGTSGNVVKFIGEQMGLDNKEAFKWGLNWLGETVHNKQTNRVLKGLPKNNGKSEKAKDESWKPIFPVPDNVNQYPDLKADKYLSYMVNGKREVSRFAYKDADGKLMGYVVRIENADGDKITPTLTYCQNDKGQKAWKFKGFGDNRGLYGLEQLKQKPDAPVLVVEGEKTCDAARALFPDHAVVTWSNGCGAVQKSDWSVLKDRDVIVFPDHDQAGENAAMKIAGIMKGHGNVSVKIVDVPATLPHKWDLADALPEGTSMEHIQTLVKDAKVPDLEKHAAQQMSNTKERVPTKNPVKKQEISDQEVDAIAKALKIEDWRNSHDTHVEKETIRIVHEHLKKDPSLKDLNSTQLQIKAIVIGLAMQQTQINRGFYKDKMTPEQFKSSYEMAYLSERLVARCYNEKIKIDCDHVLSRAVTDHKNGHLERVNHPQITFAQDHYHDMHQQLQQAHHHQTQIHQQMQLEQDRHMQHARGFEIGF